MLNCLRLNQESDGCNYKASGFSLALGLCIYCSIARGTFRLIQPILREPQRAVPLPQKALPDYSQLLPGLELSGGWAMIVWGTGLSS